MHLKKHHTDTAILVFARTAVTEAKAKSLSGPDKCYQSKKIAGALLKYTLDQAIRTALPVIHISENEQIGETFGERFATSFKTVFDKGYQKVIAIGSDCPSLNTFSLLKAAEMLKDGCPVLGPARDGGLYLVGMHKNEFDQHNFELIGWQTGSDSAELAGFFDKQEKKLIVLNVKNDIDHISVLTDMTRYRQLPAFLFYQIIFFVSTLKNSYLLCCYLLFRTRLLSAHHALRAPPVLFSIQNIY